ncbi:MAG: hypothetical protein P8X61_09325 [Limibacillus sp.]
MALNRRQARFPAGDEGATGGPADEGALKGGRLGLRTGQQPGDGFALRGGRRVQKLGQQLLKSLPGVEETAQERRVMGPGAQLRRQGKVVFSDLIEGP